MVPTVGRRVRRSPGVGMLVVTAALSGEVGRQFGLRALRRREGNRMARFIGLDEADARRRLSTVGTELVPVGTTGSEAETAAIAAVLPEDERQERGVYVALPPAPGREHEGPCVWHTNAVHEAHTVTSGLGILEFITDEGVVSAVIEAGDLMVIRSAEHRLLPLVEQRLVVHYSGPADGEVGYVATGRTPEPWPRIT